MKIRRSSSPFFSRLTAGGDASVRGSETRLGGALLRQQLPRHKRQNTAMSVVIDLDWCIDAQFQWHGAFLPIFAFDLECYRFSRLNCVRQSDKRKAFRAVEADRLRRCSVGKLQWQHAHAYKI